MEIMNLDNSMIGVALLEECNFSCIHCGREDYLYPGYKLKLEQMETCLSDCHDLSIQRLYFTGGEPTLWTDENLDLVGLLVEVAEAGFIPGFTTNGSNFVDYSKCHSFLERYFSESDKPLHIFISVDTFHGNFDAESGRAVSLDNVIRYRSDMPETELLSVSVAATISKDYSSLIPDEMIEHYRYLGVGFGFRPLMLRGKAKILSHLCPNTESDEPDDLGAYYRFRPQQKREPSRRLVLIDNNYYLSSPLEEVAQLGYLQEDAIAAYFKVRGAV